MPLDEGAPFGRLIQRPLILEAASFPAPPVVPPPPVDAPPPALPPPAVVPPPAAFAPPTMPPVTPPPIGETASGSKPEITLFVVVIMLFDTVVWLLAGLLLVDTPMVVPAADE